MTQVLGLHVGQIAGEREDQLGSASQGVVQQCDEATERTDLHRGILEHAQSECPQQLLELRKLRSPPDDDRLEPGRPHDPDGPLQQAQAPAGCLVGARNRQQSLGPPHSTRRAADEDPPEI